MVRAYLVFYLCYSGNYGCIDLENNEEDMEDMEDKIFIDTTFYDERIDYYMDYEADLLVLQEEYEFDKGDGIPFNSHNITSYKGYGDIDFWIDVKGLKYILNFWREAKEWHILRESKRINHARNDVTQEGK